MLNTKTCFVLIFPQRINSFDQDILHNVDINPLGDLFIIDYIFELSKFNNTNNHIV